MWLWETWKLIREDKAEQYSMLYAIVPLAQTPWDKKHSQSQRKHSNIVQKAIENIAPWTNTKDRRRSSHLRGKVKPGEVVVMLDAGDQADLGIYSDAKIVKR